MMLLSSVRRQQMFDCFAGALTGSGYRARLRAAGFTGIEVRAVRP
jgi:hypothetical protein